MTDSDVDGRAEGAIASRRILIARVVVAGLFGVLLPVLLLLLLGGGDTALDLDSGEVDFGKALNTVVEPLSAVLVLASWTAGIAAEVYLELLDRGGANARALGRLEKVAARRADLWEATAGLDSVLIDIRKHFGQLAPAHDGVDLFTEYYRTRITDLCRQLAVTATSRELRVNQTHFDTTEVLLSCLTGEPGDDEFKAVHFLTQNAFVEDVPHAQSFLRRFEEKVAREEVNNVQRLFIVDDDKEGEQLTDEFTLGYVAYHANAKGFDYKILPRSTYERYLADVTGPLAEDFGIYGSRHVYETAVASSRAINGTFIADPERVEIYQRHFKRCWEAGRPFADYSSATLPDVKTADEVFDTIFRRLHGNHGGSVVGQEGKTLRFHSAKSTADAIDYAVIGDAVRSILESVGLCAMATVSPEGEAHVNTAFFAVDYDPLTFWVLTPPMTQHSSYIETNNSVALAIYSTDQQWNRAKCGLQVQGRAQRVSDEDVLGPLATYGARFPELLQILDDPKSLDGLESRFYGIVARRVRVFDEERLGDEVWIDVNV